MTQQELATKFQRHQTTISKMEKGVIPVADNVARIIADVEVGEGTRLAILRRRFKKTLAEAAMETGVHEHILSEMERGLRDPVAVEYEQWIASLVS